MAKKFTVRVCTGADGFFLPQASRKEGIKCVDALINRMQTNAYYVALHEDSERGYRTLMMFERTSLTDPWTQTVGGPE